MSQTTQDFSRQICNNNQNDCPISMKMSARELPAQDTSLLHTSFFFILRHSSYYILPTCLPKENKMYLESGDCCQQTIISCGNDLACVSNKSPRTDSLTYEDFVPRIQIRGTVLSRNTPADKRFVLLIHIHSNSHKLCDKDLQLNMNV